MDPMLVDPTLQKGEDNDSQEIDRSGAHVPAKLYQRVPKGSMDAFSRSMLIALLACYAAIVAMRVSYTMQNHPLTDFKVREQYLLWSLQSFPIAVSSIS